MAAKRELRPRRAWVWLAGGVVGLVCVVGLGRVLRPSPEVALRVFHAQHHDLETAEDQLLCPLIRAGPGACAAITQDIADPEKPLRGYAIHALGSLGCRGALETLVSMFEDEGERDDIRGDALVAIWRIERSLAEPLAWAVSGRPDHLGSTSRYVLRGDVQPAMTYWDAVICSHD